MSDKKPESIDPNINFPSKRRVVWELFEDVRVANTWLFIYSSAITLVVCILSLVLVTIFRKPPYILTQDEGFVMWRTTEAFQLKDDMVRSFADQVLSKIQNMSPGAYDLAPISGMVNSKIIDFYMKKATEGAEDRNRTNKRQLYFLNEIKRTSAVKDFPNYLQFICKGEKTTYQEKVDAAGNVRVIPNAETVYYILITEQRNPKPANPWGLFVVGIKALNQTDGDPVWEDATELTGSRDLEGKTIKSTETSR